MPWSNRTRAIVAVGSRKSKMRVSMENRGDGGQRQPRQAGVEPMDGSAERVAGDVEGHGHQGHGGDDALELEAEGLVCRDLEIHGVVRERGGGSQLPRG